jgi:pimeloyl-ACP methyl ester carboxylesterase
MKIFLLIHGSWHSAWNWHKVIPLLETSGNMAIALDLPGMGRDKTPIEGVTLDLSVKKVCSILERLDDKVILVGHSKNGVIISQVAELMPEKVEKLIYLAAYLIPNGKTQAEYSAMDTQGLLKPYVQRFPETNSHTLDSSIYQEGLYHDCTDDIAQMAIFILGHEPVKTGTTPLVLTDENYGAVPKYYIECTDDRAVTPFIQKMMYEESPCEKVYQMHTSHSPFFSKPKELVEIFLEISALP